MPRRHRFHLVALAMTMALAACGGGEDPPPPATSSPSVTAQSPTSLRLDWDANTESDLAGYRVYAATASGAYGATPVALVPAGTTFFVASGLKPGVTYFFRITAVDTAGNQSPPSNEVSLLL